MDQPQIPVIEPPVSVPTSESTPESPPLEVLSSLPLPTPSEPEAMVTPRVETESVSVPESIPVPVFVGENGDDLKTCLRIQKL